MGTAVQASFEALGTSLFDTTFVVLDLETTGVSPATDRITEVGAVKVRAGEVLGEFQTLVHPGRPIPPGIVALTGISDRMVSGAPPIEAVLPSLQEFLRDAVFVAHNAGFDGGFLTAELTRHGYPPLANPVVDTRRLARRVLRDEVRDLRLATLARHLRSRVVPEHRALIDARATVDVLHGLIERAGALGATTLEDLQDLARSTSDRAFRKVGLVRDAPSAPGVYRFLGEREEVLYVGKASDLRQRLRQYFGQDPRRRIADMIRDTVAVAWTVTETPLEAEVREIRAIAATRPRYNRRSKHPERAVHVKLTRERFPRLSIVTSVRDDGALYLGPMGSRRTAERFVEAVHDALPLRQCTTRLRVAQDHPACVLKDLGRCGAPCDGTQSADDYAAVVERYRDAVTGDPGALLDPLRRRMHDHARARRFERASRVRSRLHALAGVLAGWRGVERLAVVDEVAAARSVGAVDEVVLVRAGRLVATARVPAGSDLAAIRRRLAGVDALEHRDGPVVAADVEEVRLVRSWLDRPGARVLWTSGTWAEPVAGGAALAQTVAEARRVARQLRQDRQALAGVKVARRDRRDHTTSNHGLQDSASEAVAPSSRPSHVTRTR